MDVNYQHAANGSLSNNLLFNENCNYKLLIFTILQNTNYRKIGVIDSLTALQYAEVM